MQPTKYWNIFWFFNLLPIPNHLRDWNTKSTGYIQQLHIKCPLDVQIVAILAHFKVISSIFYLTNGKWRYHITKSMHQKHSILNLKLNIINETTCQFTVKRKYFVELYYISVSNRIVLNVAEFWNENSFFVDLVPRFLQIIKSYQFFSQIFIQPIKST